MYFLSVVCLSVSVFCCECFFVRLFLLFSVYLCVLVGVCVFVVCVCECMCDFYVLWVCVFVNVYLFVC